LGYRLPTEAEWEYVCRAGTTTLYSFGDRWCDWGARWPNPWGLWDMHHSLSEWCQDWYAKDYYARSPVQDPQGPSTGEYRVLRSGVACWFSVANTRSASRHADTPDLGHNNADGLRVVLDIGRSQAKTTVPR